VVLSRRVSEREKLFAGDGWRIEIQEVLIMPAIVDILQIIADAVPNFGDLLAKEPQCQHLAEYLTGLMVARRKSVNGMRDEFAVTTYQSCWKPQRLRFQRDIIELPSDLEINAIEEQHCLK